MEQAKQYLFRFQQAESIIEKQQIAQEYKSFYETLDYVCRRQADEETVVLWDSITQKIDELEPLMEQAKRLLDKNKHVVSR